MESRYFIAATLGALALAWPLSAQAQQSASGQASVSTDGLTSTGSGSGSAADDSGAFLAGGKIGGIAPMQGLYPYLHGGIDLGYVFPNTGRTIAAYLGTEYTAPKSDGTQTEPEMPSRIPGGTYDWEIRQRILVFQPTFLYRFTWLTDAVVPFAGIGPRMYLLKTVARGTAGGETIHDTKETTTKFGFGIPVGAELPLGPGGLTAELLFQWGPLDHETTGDTHLSALSLLFGYRALL